MSDELTPITRKETFLAKAGGQNVVTPTPITREETFLQAIIDNGSGGGGGGGTGGGVLVVGVDMQTMTLDKTWKEINEAAFSVAKADTGAGNIWLPVFTTSNDSGNYDVDIASPSQSGDTITFREMLFRTNSETGYPVMVQ